MELVYQQFLNQATKTWIFGDLFVVQSYTPMKRLKKNSDVCLKGQFGTSPVPGLFSSPFPQIVSFKMSLKFHEISMSGWELERIAMFWWNFNVWVRNGTDRNVFKLRVADVASRSQRCRRWKSQRRFPHKPRVETGAWMSRWKLGSMVSKWVICPINPPFIRRWNNPLIRSPLILTSRDIRLRFIHLKRMAPWLPAYALWWWQMILGMRMLG